jgi:purine-binding chemotaxis protein CheW
MSRELPSILDLRTRRYAQQQAAARFVDLEAICFSRAGAAYALPLSASCEVRPLSAYTAMPGASPIVPGLIIYRGELLSLHDLAAFLATPPAQAPSWMLIVELEKGRRRIGLLADEIEGVTGLLEDELMPVPATFGAQAQAFRGLLPGGAMLIDCQGLAQTTAFMNAY